MVPFSVIDDAALLDAYDHQCFGATPITRACSNGSRPVLEALISMGADVNRRGDWNMGPWSPLHLAVMERNFELAEYLLEHGATFDAHGAAGLGRLEHLRRLLDDDPDRVHERGGDGCQPLHFADTEEVADLLLERGADINARCVDHYSTPVQYLANGRVDVARHLFSLGADTDIFSAAMAGAEGVVQKLIRDDPAVLNTKINQETFPPNLEHDVDNVLTFSIGMGCGPLHAATKGDQQSIVDIIVDAGLSPDVRGGYDDQTPLHLAAWNDHVAVASKLLDRGADIHIRSGSIHHNSPAGWAIVAGSADLSNY